MSKVEELRVSRVLRNYQALRKAIAEITHAEERLNRDYRSRHFTVTRARDEAAEHTEDRFQVQIEELNSVIAEAVTRVQAVSDKRSTRVERSHLVAQRQLPKRVKDVRATWSGDLQMRRFRAERKLEADTITAENEFADYSVKLEEQRTLLQKMVRGGQKLFGSFGPFQKRLREELSSSSTPSPVASRDTLTEELTAELEAGREKLKAFHKLSMVRLFLITPPITLALIILICCAVLAFVMGFNQTAFIVAGVLALMGIVGTFALHGMATKQGRELAEQIAVALGHGKSLHEQCKVAAQKQHDEQIASLKSGLEATLAEVERLRASGGGLDKDFEQREKDKLNAKFDRIKIKLGAMLQARLHHIEIQRAEREAVLRGEADARIQQFDSVRDGEHGELGQQTQKQWDALIAQWQERVIPHYEELREAEAEVSPHFPAWSQAMVDDWSPPPTFTPTLKFGQLDADLSRIAGGLPEDERLALPGPPQLRLPLALTFPDEGSLLFETQGPGGQIVFDTLNNIVLRLLANTPPGKITFTILDPVGLGQNFAGLMHLADYEESLINRRIWTQRDQIEERLSELSEHIEKVIQMYLRNEYETITQYNEMAGSVAEKYHFLIVADFPTSFGETAGAKLQSIIASGAKCGVYTLIHRDLRQGLPDGFTEEELHANSVRVHQSPEGPFTVEDVKPDGSAFLVLDAPPNASLAGDFIHKAGKKSIDSNRVEVPFSQIAPKQDEYWTGDTTNELRVAIGRTGATKQQIMAIGKGTRQHALFAGKTGSGKSTLFHVIITNLALSCSPEQVEFYLIDFKKGVEFKCYATHRLPHARVVAIESDREFALSVLQRVDGELKRRGDMFRQLGVQDVAGYKRAGGKEPMPRSLLIIDEFQEFFVEDDAVAQSASLLFDRIVRQGRAFGIHVLLGSQTLGGAYSLARATLGQMVIRVALQCNEADAYLIMDENNPAPRLLSRPGEGIYNDAAGAFEGNSPFQVVWLSDEERDLWLDKVNELASQRHMRMGSPIVFEGNAPADIGENDLLNEALATRPVKMPSAARCWLGAPNSIKGPTEAVFNRQSGNHMLIVGQRDEAALVMLGLCLLSLAAQHPASAAKFVLIHGANPGSPDAEFAARIAKMVPHEVVSSRGNDIGSIVSDLSRDLKARSDHDESESEVPPSVFVLINGIHKYKKLRQEDEFSFSMSSEDEGSGNTGEQFNTLITEGSSQGIHLIATVDTYNNVNRAMSRKALSEFEMRVVFQMSANDSASLIDSPKASNLGLHRAIFYNEHEGVMETFRPYAAPDGPWLAEAEAKFAETK